MCQGLLGLLAPKVQLIIQLAEFVKTRLAHPDIGRSVLNLIENALAVEQKSLEITGLGSARAQVLQKGARSPNQKFDGVNHSTWRLPLR